MLSIQVIDGQIVIDSDRRRAISHRAAEQRVRRALARENQVLHKLKPESRDYYSYGPYYVVDERNCVVSSQHDLDGLARQCGVLRPTEVLADE
jgi:hypothetical protein